MKKNFLSLFLFLWSFFLIAQESKTKKCTFEKNFKIALQNEEFVAQQAELENLIKNYKNDKTDTIIPIATVVHVVYKNAEENISSAQIRSQLEVLNKDFRKKNSDTTNVDGGFSIADVKFKFQLALKAPNGQATTGITRTYTNIDNIGLKQALFDLVPAWNNKLYLNIWVCDIDDFTAGSATPPNMGFSDDEDGVVIDYTNFGTFGNLDSGYDLGRTATHEIGHYFNLQHLWGLNGGCNDDDQVSDTPNQQGPVESCPQTNFSCGSKDMLSNYMGYIYDRCMGNFTEGQKVRMRTTLYNVRDSLQFANLLGLTSVRKINSLQRTNVYPNPTVDLVNIDIEDNNLLSGLKISLYNLQGKIINKQILKTNNGFKLKVEDLPAGLYFLSLSNNQYHSTKKIIKQ